MRCKHCDKEFIPKRKTAQFCHSTCRKLHHKNKSKSGDAKNKETSKSKGSTGNRKLFRSGDAKSYSVADIKPIVNCVNCSKPITNKKYCNRACQKSYTDNNKLNNYHRSGFLKWYLDAFKRSHCLGVLHNPDGTKQTSRDLAYLYEAYKTRNNANGCGESREIKYNLAHLDPSKGKQGRYGLLHWSNFIVAPASLNKQLGNTEYGFNLSAVSVANMMKPNSFKDGKLIHILNHYLNGAILGLLNAKPHLIARKTKSIPPNKPVADMQSVLFREIERLKINWDDIYECNGVGFTIPNPEQTYRDILTNNF